MARRCVADHDTLRAEQRKRRSPAFSIDLAVYNPIQNIEGAFANEKVACPGSPGSYVWATDYLEVALRP